GHALVPEHDGAVDHRPVGVAAPLVADEARERAGGGEVVGRLGGGLDLLPGAARGIDADAPPLAAEAVADRVGLVEDLAVNDHVPELRPVASHRTHDRVVSPRARVAADL